MKGYTRNGFAARLFDGISDSYQWPAQMFSLLQYRRWHRALVSWLPLSEKTLALDVCTGTGLVAQRIAASGSKVVGIDISPGMLHSARRSLSLNGLASRVSLVSGRAEQLPFEDSSFDIVVFTYLLRYVDDPQGTIRELGRVLKPGGYMASLEFYVPYGVWRPLWLLHTRALMPAVSRLLPGGWSEVGSFLGRSISDFYRRHSLADVKRMWEEAGLLNVEVRTLSLGGAVIMFGQKEGGSEA